MDRKEDGGVGGKQDTFTQVPAIAWFKLIHNIRLILIFVGQRKQTGPAFILFSHKTPHE
jgi:hypothetical protein